MCLSYLRNMCFHPNPATINRMICMSSFCMLELFLPIAMSNPVSEDPITEEPTTEGFPFLRRTSDLYVVQARKFTFFFGSLLSECWSAAWCLACLLMISRWT